MSEPINSTSKTRALVDAWISANKRLEMAKREVNAADCNVSNSTNELGRWLVPKEMLDRNGDWFNIWFGSGILRARTVNGKYEVEWLKRPDQKMAQDLGV